MDKHASDVIVIGAGHNGLVCAAYLAAAGLSVRVLEARDCIGGAAVTEEFHPGFRNSVYSYSVSLLNPKVIRDLSLEKHGLEIMERPAGTLSLLDGDVLQLSRDGAQAREAIAKHSKRDAARIDAFEDEISAVAIALRSLALQAPPNFGGGWRDALSLLKSGNQLRHLATEHQIVLTELMTRSLGDHLNSWFESEALKGILGLEGVIGNFADPYQAGTAYVLLHHAFGEVKGRAGAWGIARGGMGAISDSIAAAAQSKGVQIETNAAVTKILTDAKGAKGVLTEDGREFYAPVIAANLHPQLLLKKLLPSDALDDTQHRRIDSYRSHSATFRMNVALSELPRFSAMNVSDDFHFMGAIELCPSLPYMQQAYRHAKDHGWSQRPIISMQVPSTQDDSLAPAGGHVASLFCQHFQRHLPKGQSWDDVREQVADQVIGAIDEHAPNFRASVLGRQIKTPLDIERDLNMVGGDIFHGALHLDQFYSMRPIPGIAGYRMPTPGVYLCGSGAHPGGGVSGLPGHNAAQAILRDR
ncbi:NAD(P)/FAD-dependent oxidoreductase [Congregibacter variabilis]|uniref:Pyridine nucleotide-disulfide oxidoreductase domain-containing protein 2 n=1 Tax=Congregibacter variabilis TaxID=3081200 RepID=A0ABZ0I028_9GAMM|nr:NAD(P)/FAD-dependent oxidoreductase [Congregibacter sp. IMCC43200]